MRRLSYELGADGKPQAVLPGTERENPSHLFARRPLRARAIQLPCDVGLFSDDTEQLDLVSWITEQTED